MKFLKVMSRDERQRPIHINPKHIELIQGNCVFLTSGRTLSATRTGREAVPADDMSQAQLQALINTLECEYVREAPSAGS